MGLAARMRSLKSKLLSIRVGPGAVVLPPNVKGIHLEFAYKMYNGHMGARKVWRFCLPRLKYHNPTVSMTVNRTTDERGPATMTILFRSGGLAEERNVNRDIKSEEHVETIDMKSRTDYEILQDLINKTGAKTVDPSPAEEAEFKRLAILTERSIRDSARSKDLLQEKRREERERRLAIES